MDFFGFNENNTIGDVKEFFLDNTDDVLFVFDYLFQNADNGCKVIIPINKNKDVFKNKIFINMVGMFLSYFFHDEKEFMNQCKKIDFYIRYVSNYQNIPDFSQDFNVDNNSTLENIYEHCKFKNDTYGFAGNKNNTIKDFRAFLDSWFSRDLVRYVAELNINDHAFSPDFFRRISDNQEEIAPEKPSMIGGIIEEAIEKEGRKQIVLTGAPGTGKTFGVREFIASQLNCRLDELDTKDNYNFVQFHASYNYTDFVEGLKPATLNGEHTFVRVDGIFKKFCRHAAADPDKNFYFVIDEINRADLSSVFGELMFCLEESYRGKKGMVRTQYNDLPTYRYIDRKADNDETDDEDDQADTNDPSSPKEEIKNIISKARDMNYYSLMEEKLFRLFDKYVSDNPVSEDNVERLDDDIFADGFYIPENVYIIGTMNDIDRNVETFDFALRRRFRWIDIDADESLDILDTVLQEKGLTQDTINELKARAKALNGVVAENKYHLGKEFKLGQAYFAKFTTDDEDDHEGYFERELRPILNEYMRGKKNSGEFISACKTRFVADEEDNG